MRGRYTFVLLSFGLLSVCADAAPERLHPKAIAFGWDTIYCAPEDILAHAGEFDKYAYDGVVSAMEANHSAFGVSANWTRESCRKYIDIYKQFRAHAALKETFLRVCVQPEGRLSFRDDAVWARAARNLETLAWVAKESGLPGLMLDTEDYWKARQYVYNEEVDREKDGLTFAAAAELARKRSRQLFEAMYAVYPEMKTISLYLLATTPFDGHHYADLVSPTSQIEADGDLWISFVNGMIDAAPETAEIYDGNEDAYWGQRRSFDVWYADLHRRLQNVIEPENRAKYSRVIRMSHGLYLDMYTNAKGAGYYFGPRGKGTRADRFAENAAAAIRGSDGYVWLYGEKHGFINWGKVSMTREVVTYTNTTWETELPGFNRAVRYAKDPYAEMMADLETVAKEKVRVIPTANYPRTFEKGQTNLLVTAMSPGRRYALVGEMRGRNASGRLIPAERGYDNWNYGWHYPMALEKNETTGWKRFAAYLPVPPDCDGFRFYLENYSTEPAEFRNFKLVTLD